MDTPAGILVGIAGICAGVQHLRGAVRLALSRTNAGVRACRRGCFQHQLGTAGQHRRGDVGRFGLGRMRLLNECAGPRARMTVRKFAERTCVQIKRVRERACARLCLAAIQLSRCGVGDGVMFDDNGGCSCCNQICKLLLHC